MLPNEDSIKEACDLIEEVMNNEVLESSYDKNSSNVHSVYKTNTDNNKNKTTTEPKKEVKTDTSDKKEETETQKDEETTNDSINNNITNNTGDNNDGFIPPSSETRHYLTYSGVDYGTSSLIDNGTLEGNDASCFFSPNGNTQSTITNVGRENSRGIKVESSGDETNEHDTQFFIKAKNIISMKIH